MQKEIVVITGAASGIGEALSKAFIKNGAQVVALDIDDKKLNSLKSILGSSFYPFHTDVADHVAFLEVANQIQTSLGQPSIWINNAGLAKLAPFEKNSLEDFRKVIETNFFGVVHGTRIALSLMRNPVRGTIVNISSVNGFIAAPFMTSYVASKHAICGFTRALQEELKQGHSPIKLILVSPGFADTEILNQEGYSFPKWLQWIICQPDSMADEIMTGIQSGQAETNPTLHAKVLIQMHKFAPQLVRSCTRVFGAKNWKELLGLNPIKK